MRTRNAISTQHQPYLSIPIQGSNHLKVQTRKLANVHKSIMPSLKSSFAHGNGVGTCWPWNQAWPTAPGEPWPCIECPWPSSRPPSSPSVSSPSSDTPTRHPSGPFWNSPPGYGSGTFAWNNLKNHDHQMMRETGMKVEFQDLKGIQNTTTRHQLGLDQNPMMVTSKKTNWRSRNKCNLNWKKIGIYQNTHNFAMD